MRVLLQRVLSASVSVSGQVAGSIDRGILLLVGFTHGDTGKSVRELAYKAIHLRIFPDSQNRLQHSLIDVCGAVLAVPQFTLYATTTRGRRPDFTQALEPAQASHLFDQFVGDLEMGLENKVATGVFGSDMKVVLENDGQVTVILTREPV